MHASAARRLTRVRGAQLAVEGRDNLGLNIFSAAAVKLGIPQQDIHVGYARVYASLHLEPKDNSPKFSTRSENAQLAFPPSMRAKLADVPMTGTRLRCAARAPPFAAMRADARHARGRYDVRVPRAMLQAVAYHKCHEPDGSADRSTVGVAL